MNGSLQSSRFFYGTYTVRKIAILLPFSTMSYSYSSTVSWSAESIYRSDEPKYVCAMVPLSCHAAILELRHRGRHYGMSGDCDRTERLFGMVPRRPACFKTLYGRKYITYVRDDFYNFSSLDLRVSVMVINVIITRHQSRDTSLAHDYG